ncbi:hypothetical protein SAMN04489712_102607 [Thermomonospora echinospora]|uniref:DUF8094 domain-containing protein n=1 Tax=Thermomonospora echinospora TaxID=1992 RepID=A0A1H5W6D3_9ACTN|nr:hypothetical protein [Thermomonospora echinospora]SEF95045.1 hypothetical protein SAMN04489712_102607 [Thermomonospora echinospora]
MKRTSLAVPAVAVLLVGGISGCSAEERRASTTPVAVASSPEPERLTPQSAAHEFQRFVSNDDVARASGDERLALHWVADGQMALTAAEYRRAVFHGEAVPRYDYKAPTLYVPKLSESTYPQWFVAVAERTAKPAPGARTDPDEARTAVMAFIRRSPESQWKLSLSTLLRDKAELPEIAVDSEGYAGAVLTGETDLLIPPKSVAGIQAAIAEEGPDSVPAKLMKPGPGTTGYFNETRQIKKRAGKAGLAFDVVFPATLHPVFPLRTADGGAFVLYALGRDTVTLAKDTEDRPPIPTDAAHLLDSLILGNELHVSQTLQFGAYDPPKAKPKKPQPKADVIAIDGAVVRAASPQKVN